MENSAWISNYIHVKLWDIITHPYPCNFNSCFAKPSLKLTDWGRVTHICVGKLTIIGSDNGLSPGRHQPIIWTNAGILFIGPLGTDFRENFIGIQIFSLKKMHLKMSSAKWRPFCLGLNVLRHESVITSQRNHGCIFIHALSSVYLS